jgi:hypothetical protein
MTAKVTSTSISGMERGTPGDEQRREERLAPRNNAPCASAPMRGGPDEQHHLIRPRVLPVARVEAEHGEDGYLDDGRGDGEDQHRPDVRLKLRAVQPQGERQHRGHGQRRMSAASR